MMQIKDIWQKELQHYLAQIILIGSVFGVGRQYVSLLVIGNGVWILPYYSVSYSVVDGLNFLLKFLLMFVGAFALNNHSGSMSGKTWQQRFSSTVPYLLFCGFLSILLIILRSYFYFVSMVLFILFVMIIFKKFTEKDFEMEKQIIVFSTLAIVISAMDVLKVKSPEDHSILKESPIIKEQLKGLHISAFYVNDTYVFIQTQNNTEKKLMILKTDELLDTPAKAITLPCN